MRPSPGGLVARLEKSNMYQTTFSFCIDYQSDKGRSAYISGHDNVDTAKTELLKYLNYYAQLPRDIIAFELTEYCVTCQGYGEVFQPYKRRCGGKKVRCPDCKGKGLPKDIIRL